MLHGTANVAEFTMPGQAGVWVDYSHQLGRICINPECGAVIDDDNKSGLCHVCVMRRHARRSIARKTMSLVCQPGLASTDRDAARALVRGALVRYFGLSEPSLDATDG
jgi:hypothetical protein